MENEHDKTAAALRMAIQMEKDGKEYYLKASQESGNDLGRKLLESLAEEEDLHQQQFTKIYIAISDNKAWPKVKFKPDGGKGLKTVFTQAIDKVGSEAQPMDTELEALQTAMSMENKTYDFYTARGRDAAYDAEKKFYQALAAQEKGHHQVLLDYYEYLKDPAAYFVEKEHPSLEG